MAFANGGSIVTNGLVLALDAADRNSYVSGSTTWTDLSGNNNTSTLTNGPAFNSGSGGSIVFDGTNDYLSFSGVTLNTNTGFTIDVWIYINDPQSVYANFWTYWYSTQPSGFEWGTYASGSFQGIFIFKDNGASGAPGINSPYVGNSWANIVIGCSATIPFMYCNGSFVGNTTAFRNTSFTISNLFRSQTNTDRYYKASQSSIKIYNRALSATEIQQNYNAIKSRFNL